MDANLGTTNLLLGIMAVVSVLEALLLIGSGIALFIVYRRVMDLVEGLEQDRDQDQAADHRQDAALARLHPGQRRPQVVRDVGHLTNLPTAPRCGGGRCDGSGWSRGCK